MLNSTVAKVSSAAGSEVVCYEVPATKQLANVTINVANLGTTPATLTLGVTDGVSLNDVDLLEDGAQLVAGAGVIRRTDVIMGPGEKVIINSDSNDLAVRVFGLEQQ